MRSFINKLAWNISTIGSMQANFKKRRILFYAPFNSRSRDNESLMLKFKEQGHEVIFLSQAEGYDIMEVLEAGGVRTFKTNLPLNTKVALLKNIAFLIRFCRK